MGDIATRLRSILTNEVCLHSRLSMDRNSLDSRSSLDQRSSLDRSIATAGPQTPTAGGGSVPATSPMRCEGVAPAGPSPFEVWEQQEGPVHAALPPRLAADPAVAAVLLAWGSGRGPSQPRSQERAHVVVEADAADLATTAALLAMGGCGGAADQPPLELPPLAPGTR